jgi:hypothetical protein
MTVDLTFTALGASPVCNVVIQFTLTVANDEMLMANLGLLDVACECHDNRGVCIVLLSVDWHKPLWRLTLDQLGVIGKDTV